MINQKLISDLSDSIKIILNKELEKGNELVEASQGWPEENSIFITLKLPFLMTHENKNLEYRELTDRHYWKGEYYDKKSKHIITCRFNDFKER